MARFTAALAVLLALSAIAVVHGQGASTNTIIRPPPTNPPPGGGGGDPLMYDFVGRLFDFKGKAGEFFNIYSDEAHQINMGLFPAFLNGHNGTYMNTYGFACGNSRVNVSLAGENGLRVEMWQDKNTESSVLVSGEPVEAIIGSDYSKVSIKMEAFETPGGHTVEIKSDVLTFAVRTAPAGIIDNDGVAQPAFLNFEVALVKSPVGGKAAGIIGETAIEASNKIQRASADLDVTKEAPEAVNRPEDAVYHVSGMFGTDFAANKFTGAAVTTPVGTSRRLMRSDYFAGVQFPLTAFSK